MTITLDARGLRCPLPIIHLAKLAATVADGTVIVVRSTDPAAPGDVAAWARMRGHELLADPMRAGEADGEQQVILAPGAVVGTDTEATATSTGVRVSATA